MERFADNPSLQVLSFLIVPFLHHVTRIHIHSPFIICRTYILFYHDVKFMPVGMFQYVSMT